MDNVCIVFAFLEARTHENIQTLATMPSNRVLKKGIYFCGSIRAGRQDVDLYATLIKKLFHYGEVLTPFVGDKGITSTGSEHEGGDKSIHDRDVQLLEQSEGIYFIETL